MMLITQSLSREILYGTFASVSALVNRGADVNEKDTWGYTPLIQATIINNLPIAQLLLSKGAKIDLRDITGQTALQWAVNRRYQTLCSLYLDHQADPNHYSADGQPIMVNPILRGEHDLIQLLIVKGADLEFPQNYINAKLIGHRYELTGKADIINTRGKFIELDFEGFYLEFTVGIILRTLITFFNSKEGKSYHAYNLVIQKIIRTLKESVELIKHKYTLDVDRKNDPNIRKLLDKDLVMIPVGYEGHAITFIKYNNFFAKCDRGVKHIVDTVIAQKVGNPYAMNADFLKDLMYTNKTSDYINNDIRKILQLTPFTTLPARYQLSGNCSWANVEASIPAMMLLLMSKENMGRGELASLKKSIMEYYDTWVEWDKDRVLDECINDFYQEDHVRRTSIATIIATILLQRCRPEFPKEVARAKKILSILTIPEYTFILKGYINIYCTKASGKIGEDFTRLLKISGLNFSTLTLKK
jgi:hypothetical protein